MSRSVVILTGEASGDLYGADLARSLQARFPKLTLYGVGGARMHAAGVHLLADSRAWGAIGVVEAAKVAPKVLVAFQRVKRSPATQARPDLDRSHRLRRVQCAAELLGESTRHARGVLHPTRQLAARAARRRPAPLYGLGADSVRVVSDTPPSDGRTSALGATSAPTLSPRF
jgi:hypothetical protein